MKQRVLVVEDDPAISRVVQDNLEFEGYEVRHVSDGSRVLEIIRTFAPDLILLDLVLPGLDGFTICGAVGEGVQRTPIIVISARTGKDDRIRALQLGADDYLVKPFSIDELLARMMAVLRRTHVSPSDKLTLGRLTIDLSAMSASRDGKPVALTYREFEMLRLLWAHREEVVSRERLLRTVWGYSEIPVTRTVDHFVARLRSKIETDPRHPQYLKTVYGKGYSLSTGTR